MIRIENMQNNMEILASLENRLYDAAVTEDTAALKEFLNSSPVLLQKVSCTYQNRTPRHVAAMQGHLPFVREILNLSPHLAEQLDSQQVSPLHVASGEGYLEIVEELVAIAPQMCFSRDGQGRNPLHLAAIKGHVLVLSELVKTAPLAARETAGRGMTAMHLCAKHRQLVALKILMERFADLINAGDEDGNTILHMAVGDKQIETTRYLVEDTIIDLKAKNSKGQTAQDILQNDPIDSELAQILKLGLSKYSNKTQIRLKKWLTDKRDAIMVVAILIATMAFQAAVNPPGGVWQEDLIQDSQGNPVLNPHRAGESVMAYVDEKAYKNFIRSNTVAFILSLSNILLLISGLPFRRRLFAWILMVIMWLTVTSIAVAYGISVFVVSPMKDSKTVEKAMTIGIAVWCSLMGILLVGNTMWLVDRWLKYKGVRIWRPRRLVHFLKTGRDLDNENGGHGKV